MTDADAAGTSAEVERLLEQLMPDLSPKGRRTLWLVFQGLVVAEAVSRLEGEELKEFLDRVRPSYSELLGLDPGEALDGDYTEDRG